MLHVGPDLTIDNNSFLVNSHGVYPLATLTEASYPVPAIQLVLAGNAWFAVESLDQPDSWNGSLGDYINQLSSILSTQLGSAYSSHRVEFPGESIGESINYAGWVHVEDPDGLVNLVMLDYNSSPALLAISFTVQLQKLMFDYIAMKVELNIAINEADYILQPDFCWLNNRFDRVTSCIDSMSGLLASHVAYGVVGDSMDDYLSASHLQLEELMQSLQPFRRSVWPILDMLHPLINQLALQAGGLTFSAIFSSLLAADHQGDASSMTKIRLGNVRHAALPSGRRHPSVIFVSKGVASIPFDSANPLHYVLFSLFVTAKGYRVTNQCLRLSLQASPGELAEFLGIPDSHSARAMVRSQIEQLNRVIQRIEAVVHALGQHYYPQYWQPNHYQAISLCDGHSIVFHSDDLQPRAGWQHLLPPEPEESDGEEEQGE